MRLTLVAGVTALFLAIAAPCARAQTSEDQQARALFDAGRTAYEAGRFDQALRYFREAYELSHRPALLFNIASAADRLLNIDEALQAYRDYLAAVPDAENRELAQSRITFLEGHQSPQPDEHHDTADAHDTGSTSDSAPQDSGSSGGGGDVTGEWWFWTLIAVLVVGAGVGITAGIVVGTSGVQPPLEGDVRVSMALAEWQ